MPDDTLLNKAAIVERCVARARQEYAKDPDGFGHDITRQDAAILNIQRGCEACLDIGHRIIQRRRLGIPQSARDVFALLEQAGIIDAPLADRLKKMVGFRNIAVHDYQTLHMAVVIEVITKRLDDLLTFAHIVHRDLAP